MASKRLRFHPEAEQEYLTSLAWYRNRSLIAAVNFEAAFDQAVERNPGSSPALANLLPGLPKVHPQAIPISIVYQDYASEIIVFAVAHGRRKPGYWRDRV